MCNEDLAWQFGKGKGSKLVPLQSRNLGCADQQMVTVECLLYVASNLSIWSCPFVSKEHRKYQKYGYHRERFKVLTRDVQEPDIKSISCLLVPWSMLCQAIRCNALWKRYGSWFSTLQDSSYLFFQGGGMIQINKWHRQFFKYIQQARG